MTGIQCNRTRSLLLAVLLLLGMQAAAQEVNYDSLLQRIDTIANPVYKPVVSFSAGVLNFRGDVRNAVLSPATGSYAGQLNVSTFVDKQHHFVANFSLLMGSLNGNAYSVDDVSRNLNFRTDILSIGLHVEYRFGHFIPPDYPIRPYVSLGVESLNFSAKGDMKDAEGTLYHYWSDGSIRDVAENPTDPGTRLFRDFRYETDLRLYEREEFGLGGYSQRALGIPLGLGAHFHMGERTFFSLGVSYHYAFTDMLDNVAYEGTSIRGSRGNDSYLFTHLSAHLDLFSDPSTRTVDLLYADAEFDPAFFDDEDGDFVLDVSDPCPGTPYGVEVDSLGCPLDGDLDGVPDYLDQELATAAGAWVDDRGVTVSESAFLLSMQSRGNAMSRADVAAYMALLEDEYRLQLGGEIPEQFQSLDADGDGYLSFDELLLTIDQYFDYQLELSLEELREVNEFFFSQ
ncbi:MAG: hypothetical protein R2751_02450 [Bacteroidales bacterium]